MTTQEIADRLVELSRQGKSEQAYKELFADDAVAIEPMGPDGPGPVKTQGLDNLLAKSKEFEKSVIELHSSSASDPIVAGNHFACTMVLDATMKEMGRMKMEEICLYEVKDGKIASEQFFYSMG